MIFTALFEVFKFILDLIFSIIPDIPSLPESIMESFNTYLDLIFSNGIQLIGYFVRIETVVILLPLSVVVANLEVIYKIIIFILRKIPFMNLS